LSIEQVSSSWSWSSLGYAFAEAEAEADIEATQQAVATNGAALAAAADGAPLSLSERYRQKKSAQGRRTALAGFQASNLVAADGVAQPTAQPRHAAASQRRRNRSDGNGDGHSDGKGDGGGSVGSVNSLDDNADELPRVGALVEPLSLVRASPPTKSSSGRSPRRLPSRDRSADPVPATRFFQKSPERAAERADAAKATETGGFEPPALSTRSSGLSTSLSASFGFTIGSPMGSRPV
jgi:hypothetical protein